MQITPISFQAYTPINTPQRRENIIKASKIAVPSLVASTAVMAATKVAKNSDATPIKMASRLSKAGAAGLITAAVLTAITYVNKENIVQGINKVKEVFRRTDGEKKLETDTEIKDKEEPVINAETEDKNGQNSSNPFAPADGTKMPEINLDNALKEASKLTGNQVGILSPQQKIDNKFQKMPS